MELLTLGSRPRCPQKSVSKKCPKKASKIVSQKRSKKVSKNELPTLGSRPLCLLWGSSCCCSPLLPTCNISVSYFGLNLVWGRCPPHLQHITSNYLILTPIYQKTQCLTSRDFSSPVGNTQLRWRLWLAGPPIGGWRPSGEQLDENGQLSWLIVGAALGEQLTNSSQVICLGGGGPCLALRQTGLRLKPQM